MVLTIVLDNSVLVLNHPEKNSNFYKTYRILKLLLSSPLNKSNNLKIFVRTNKSILIELDPRIEIPDDIEEYSDLFEYLSKKYKLKSSNNVILAKIVKNPISIYLNPNTFKIGINGEGRVLELKDIKENILKNNSYTFFINSKEEVEYNVRLSNYDLSIDSCISRIIGLFEASLDIF